MIDIRQMRYFVAVAETLHFGRAAERLHLSQPPLSRQIAALEAELGVRLLERGSRRVELTHAGRRFLEDSRAVLSAFEQACRNARLADHGELGELSVGFMMHAANTVIPALARRYIDAHPRIQLRLREILPSGLIEGVLRGEFDAGVMFDPGPVPGLKTREILAERLRLAVQPSHPLAARDLIRAADLEGEPLLATPEEVSPLVRQAIVDYCRSGGFAPVFRLEAQLQQTLVNLVAENLGVALVPESMERLKLPGVVFRDLEHAPVVKHVIAWKPGNANPALAPFLAAAEGLQRQAW